LRAVSGSAPRIRLMELYFRTMETTIWCEAGQASAAARSGAGSFAVEHVPGHQQRRDDVQDRTDLLAATGEELDGAVADDPGADAVGDGEGQRHDQDGQEGGHALADLVPV